MPKKKKELKFEDLTAAQKKRVAEFLYEHLHDMWVDEDDIADQYGKDYMPSIKAVAEFLEKDYENIK